VIGKNGLLPVCGSRSVSAKTRVVEVTAWSTTFVVDVVATTEIGGPMSMNVVVVCIVEVTPPTVVVVASVVVVVAGIVVVVVEVVVVVVEQLHGGCEGVVPCADAGGAKPSTAAPTTPNMIRTPRAERLSITPPPLVFAP
jgi:hypothetical protein